MTPQEHIDQLLEENNIRVFWHENQRRACCILPNTSLNKELTAFSVNMSLGLDLTGSDIQERLVIIPRIRSVRAYFASLHEFGHVLTGQTYQGWNNDTVRCELEAWNWALPRTVLPLTPHITKIITERWLGSYLRLHGPLYYADETVDEFCKRTQVSIQTICKS